MDGWLHKIDVTKEKQLEDLLKTFEQLQVQLQKQTEDANKFFREIDKNIDKLQIAKSQTEKKY